MEGKWMSSQSHSPNFHLLLKIKEFTRSLITDLSNGQSPIILIHRFRNHCTHRNCNCFCGSDLPCGKDVLTLSRESHVHRIDVMLRVLLIVQKLLQENRHCSKRDIYYMHPSVFSDQSVVDHAINDICVLMQCSRHNLNVVNFLSSVLFAALLLVWLSLNCCTAQSVDFGDSEFLVSAGKGLVMGWIRFFEGTRLFDCISSPNKVHPIPVHVEDVKDIISVAHYILVVEKESVFQRLANDQFCSANHCIVITGRGYPDIPTRRFLRLLVEDLHLPAYCLVDCDPYGFDILTTYRFGSMQMAYDTKHLGIPEIQWLGAYPSDSDTYFVPKQCLLPLTAEDKRKLEAMLLRCYLEREVPQWSLELKMMLEKGVKFEIEALSVHNLSFLSESYLPSKIQGVYNVSIDGERGTVKVTGRVNPSTILGLLEKYGKHAKVKYIKFDGEVVDRRTLSYYGGRGGGGGGYAPYAMGSSYPMVPGYAPYAMGSSYPMVPPMPPSLPPQYHPQLVPFYPPPPPPPVWPPMTRPYGPPPYWQPPPLPHFCPRADEVPSEDICPIM
ncbi:hypothetical protein PIB30_046102 [Stylosanthes scabra]|uniref:DNA topoisomerase (ATP-hydrolyzing) n=1 Tax=Stylosanthes scabra TaxID=79078 RepID=A0ABU6XFE1_9FABA|nr:hypothetical protein [Stylosanthes scabra]